MSDAAPPDVKRRRLSAVDGPHQDARCLADLPSGTLAHAASFLAAPSRALFAIALDKNSSTSPPNERSSAIVGNHHWDTLDFGQIEKELAAKLSDDDISAVLQCVDAVNNVKRLKLTNCTNITGVGLVPLRGSLIIEQIDLSLIGICLHQEPLISLDHVLPILDSIIERDGCALKHLQFPSMWQYEPSFEFHALIGRYNEMRNRGTVRCLECNRSLPGTASGSWVITDDDNYYGIHMYTCCDCLKNYCYCCDSNGEEKKMLRSCDICERDYCKGCSEMTRCSGCEEKICNDCCKYECVECNKKFCLECGQKGKSMHKCDYCDKCYCQGCSNNEVVYSYTWCSQCDVKCCKDCRLQRYRQGRLNCTQCIKESVAKDESLARKQLQEENEQLKVEVEALKRENRELKLLITKSS